MIFLTWPTCYRLFSILFRQLTVELSKQMCSGNRAFELGQRHADAHSQLTAALSLWEPCIALKSASYEKADLVESGDHSAQWSSVAASSPQAAIYKVAFAASASR